MDIHQQIQCKDDSQLPEVIRAEVNFLNFPFFALYHQDVRKRTETDYRSVVHRDGQKLEISWNVSANPKYGYPGPFDRKLHRAIEQIISELKPPIQNPVSIGSLYSLAKALGLSSYKQGRVFKQIESALDRIAACYVESRGTFYSKNRKEWIKDKFHLYDRIVLRGRNLPNGQIADTNYLFLSSWYLDNINARYVRPIDFTYHKSLKSNIASRLYELLGVKFYGLEEGQFIRYKYSTLCQLLPITRQQYLSDAKKVLNPAHEELKQTRFLSGHQWSKDLFGAKRDWYILYWPGQRTKEEIEGLTFEFEQLPSAESLPEPRTEVEQRQAELIPVSATPELDEIWERVLVDLEQELSPANFKSWIEGTVLLSLEEDRAVIGAPSRFVREHLESWFKGRIKKALLNAVGREVDLEFVVVRV